MMISVRTTRKGSKIGKTVLERLRIKRVLRKGWKAKRRTPSFKVKLVCRVGESRKGSDIPFFGKASALFNMQLRKRAVAAKQELCDHEFTDTIDMYDSVCSKCGMSLIRHAFTECP